MSGTLKIDFLKFSQHNSSVEVKYTYSDLPTAFAQMVRELPRGLDGNFLNNEDTLIALEGMAPPREWFEAQEGRLTGADKEAMKTLPTLVQAVAPILMPLQQQTWYEDLTVGAPEIIDGQWVRPATVVDLRTDETLEALRRKMLAYLADERYKHEVGGITVNGATIKTDRESQATITGAYARAQAEETTSVAWKADNGFVELDCASIIGFGDAVFNHVQACFAREAELAAQISAAHSWQGLMAIDIDGGWPNDVYGREVAARTTLPLFEEA